MEIVIASVQVILIKFQISAMIVMFLLIAKHALIQQPIAQVAWEDYFYRIQQVALAVVHALIQLIL